MNQPRRNILSRFALAVVIGFSLTAVVTVRASSAQSPSLPVVPQPQEIAFEDGRFIIASMTPRLALQDTSGLMQALKDLQREVAIATAGFEKRAGAGDALLWLGLPEEDTAFRREAEAAGIWPADRIGAEGYALRIAGDRILLAASEATGLFYGLQTLKQMVRGYEDEGALPALRIVDWPDLRWRGIMDDISRGPLPTMAYLKEQVRRFSEMKINLMTHYVENVVATESHGDFAPPAALSIDDLRELSEYARRYHVTVVGNFQSFGHFYQILSHPQYKPLGEGKSLISPALPESYELLEDVYDEMVPAFDAPFFNVNADETFDLGRGPSKARVDSLGPGVVYAEHINRLYDLIEPHGVRMIIWGDILLEHPEVMDRIPDDVIIGTWNYDARDSFDDMIVPFDEAGYDFIVTPGVLNSSRIMPDFRQAVGNIRSFVRDGVEHGALGMFMTVWDDGGSALFARDWYGVAYAADQAWNSDPDDPTFAERFGPAVYGDDGNAIARAIEHLNRLADLGPTDGMNEKVFWTQLVPDRDQSVQISLEDWDRVLAIANQVDSILANASPSVHAEDLTVFDFTVDQYRYMAKSRMNLVAAADAFHDASFLQQEDRPAARENVLEALRHVGNTHHLLSGVRQTYVSMWLRENRTYALDRVLDQYDAHLAALSDLQQRLMEVLEDFDQGFYLPAPNQIRLDIEATSGRYFREWMMSGPIAAAGNPSDLDVDFLEAMGGEENARPQITQEFDFNGETYRWHRFASPLFAVVDLASHYERNEDAVIYAHATIESPDERRVRAVVGSNDGVEVFVNGRLVHSNPVVRTLQIDEDELWLPLQEGRNHLLLKISQGSNEWAFSFRLPDEEIRSRKNRYRIIE